MDNFYLRKYLAEGTLHNEITEKTHRGKDFKIYKR
jgi:hypothetical protein